MESTEGGLGLGLGLCLGLGLELWLGLRSVHDPRWIVSSATTLRQT